MEDMMGDGVRPYGPGKFYTILDSYIYEMTLDQGVDREVYFEGGGGWYGFIPLDRDTLQAIREIAAEHDDRLTLEETNQLRDHAAVILFERSDGIVEATWYNDPEDANDDWHEIEEEVHGGDDDDDAFSEEEMHEGYVIQDARGGGYEVAHEGKLVDTYDDMDEALKDINARMEREQFWGNIYYVNERGNIDLLDSSGNIIESRV